MLLRGFAPLDTYGGTAGGAPGGEPRRRLWFYSLGYTAFMENMGWEAGGTLLSTAAEPVGQPLHLTPAALPSGPCGSAPWWRLKQSGELREGLAAEWVADFCFRHFRGVVIDWILHQEAIHYIPQAGAGLSLFQGVSRGKKRGAIDRRGHQGVSWGSFVSGTIQRDRKLDRIEETEAMRGARSVCVPEGLRNRRDTR